MLRKAGTAALAGRRTTSTNIPKVVAVAGSLSALSTASLVFASANLVGFGVSAATGSHLHLDLIGTGAFAAAVYFGRAPGIRQLVSAACIGLWSSRLALFLFYRALQVKHDARLPFTKRKWMMAEPTSKSMMSMLAHLDTASKALLTSVLSRMIRSPRAFESAGNFSSSTIAMSLLARLLLPDKVCVDSPSVAVEMPKVAIDEPRICV